MMVDPLTIPRPANDSGMRKLVERIEMLERELSERSAMISQVTATSAENTKAPWQVTTIDFSDSLSVTLKRPAWATSVILVAGGFMQPKWDDAAGSPYVYARLKMQADGAAEVVSPEFFSWLASIDVRAGLSWPGLLRGIAGDVTVTLQSRAPASSALGGSVSVSAVAIWMR